MCKLNSCWKKPAAIDLQVEPEPKSSNTIKPQLYLVIANGQLYSMQETWFSAWKAPLWIRPILLEFQMKLCTTQLKNLIAGCWNMVDLGGYVIILVETHDKKVKLYGKRKNARCKGSLVSSRNAVVASSLTSFLSRFSTFSPNALQASRYSTSFCWMYYQWKLQKEESWLLFLAAFLGSQKNPEEEVFTTLWKSSSSLVFIIAISLFLQKALQQRKQTSRWPTKSSRSTENRWKTPTTPMW